MPVTIGALSESVPGETRVSYRSGDRRQAAAAGARVLLERGAGTSAQFPDALYKKVEWADVAAAVLAQADVLLTVQPPIARADRGPARPGAW